MSADSSSANSGPTPQQPPGKEPAGFLEKCIIALVILAIATAGARLAYKALTHVDQRCTPPVAAVSPVADKEAGDCAG